MWDIPVSTAHPLLPYLLSLSLLHPSLRWLGSCSYGNKMGPLGEAVVMETRLEWRRWGSSWGVGPLGKVCSLGLVHRDDGSFSPPLYSQQVRSGNQDLFAGTPWPFQ